MADEGDPLTIDFDKTGDDAYVLSFATPSSTYEVCLAGPDVDQLIEEMGRVRNEEIEAKVQAVGLDVPDIVAE